MFLKNIKGEFLKYSFKNKIPFPKQHNTLFSQVHMEHSPGQITSSVTIIRKFKKTEIVSSIFSELQCFETRYELQGKKLKNTKTWMLNNLLLNNQQDTKGIKKEIKNT